MTIDIIDRIDELVDEQLAAGEPEGGYESHAGAANPDPEYPECVHCGRHWHGLRITERIAHMYRRGVMDPYYDAATDDSRVVCEGSDFIRPRWIPAEYQQIAADENAQREHYGHVHVVPRRDPREVAMRIIIAVDTSGWHEAMGRFREALEQMGATFIEAAQRWSMTIGSWQLPDDPFDMSEWFTESPTCERSALPVTFGPQNWLCEMRRPQFQFPRQCRAPQTPLQVAVHQLWPEFAAVADYAPHRPGYDFSRYADTAPATGPADDRWQAAPTVHRAPPATSRRRKARARG